MPCRGMAGMLDSVARATTCMVHLQPCKTAGAVDKGAARAQHAEPSMQQAPLQGVQLPDTVKEPVTSEMGVVKSVHTQRQRANSPSQ